MYLSTTNVFVLIVLANVISSISAGLLPRISHSQIWKLPRFKSHVAPLKLHINRYDVTDRHDNLPYRKRYTTPSVKIQDRKEKIDALAQLLLVAINANSNSSESTSDFVSAPEANVNDVFDENGMLFLTPPKEYEDTKDFNRLLNKIARLNTDNEPLSYLRKPDDVFTDAEVEKIKYIVSGLVPNGLRMSQALPEADTVFKFSDIVL